MDKNKLTPNTPLILMVDDVPENIQVLHNILGAENYSFAIAMNGEETFAVLEKQLPDLILLDIVLPDTDGYSICEKLKGDEKTKDIPIIFLTAKTELQDKIRGFKLGAVDYITKPFEDEEVLARVRTHLELKLSKDIIINYSKELKRVNDSLENELRDAAKYIDSLLPLKINDDFKIDWQFFPTIYLGGDSFGYQWLDKNTLAVYLIDVSGHGVGSTLLSISVLTTLNSKLLPGTDFFSPSSVLSGLNSHFQMEKHNNKYFTICYGLFDKKNKVFTYASGGHPAPIKISKKSGETFFCKEETFFIGALSDIEFPSHTIDFERGDKIYFVSDGVFCNLDASGEILGFEQFLNLIRKNAFKQNSLDNIYDQIKFHCNAAFEDDYTIIEIEIN